MTNPYQVAPPLSESDYAALKADIAKRGVLVAVEYDEVGNVLDGHHRLRVCEELGIKNWPRITRGGLTDDEKRQHARQLNLARRHLSQSQKRDLVAAQLKDTPERSNRQIAAGLGVDHKTVQTVRAKAESTGEIPQLGKTVGSDGKARHKPVQSDRKKSKESGRPDRHVVLDPEFQAEADAAARDIEIERDERIALGGAGELATENERLRKTIGDLDKRIAALTNENGQLKRSVEFFKKNARTWEKRAREAGWKDA